MLLTPLRRRHSQKAFELHHHVFRMVEARSRSNTSSDQSVSLSRTLTRFQTRLPDLLLQRVTEKTAEAALERCTGYRGVSHNVSNSDSILRVFADKPQGCSNHSVVHSQHVRGLSNDHLFWLDTK